MSLCTRPLPGAPSITMVHYVPSMFEELSSVAVAIILTDPSNLQNGQYYFNLQLSRWRLSWIHL